MAEFVVRPARTGDARAMAELMAAVAQEREGIATEPPVDIEERTVRFARSAAESVVAVAGGRIVGTLHVSVSRHGFGELGRRVSQYRRASGELWDSIMMGLALSPALSGPGDTVS